MKKVLIIFISLAVLASLAFLGYKYLNKPTAVDLKRELILTEDDGGQADFKSLDQDAQGL